MLILLGLLLFILVTTRELLLYLLHDSFLLLWLTFVWSIIFRRRISFSLLVLSRKLFFDFLYESLLLLSICYSTFDIIALRSGNGYVASIFLILLAGYLLLDLTLQPLLLLLPAFFITARLSKLPSNTDFISKNRHKM